MIHSKERLKELANSNEQMLLILILEEQEKQTALLEQIAGGNHEQNTSDRKRNTDGRSYTKRQRDNTLD